MSAPHHQKHQMTPPSSWRLLAWGLCIFGALALLTTSSTYWMNQDLGRTTPYLVVFQYHATRWMLWALPVVAIFQITVRLRLTRYNLAKALLLHLFLSLAWLPLYWLMVLLLSVVQDMLPMDQVRPQFMQYLGFNALVDYYWYWIILLAAHAWIWFKESMSAREARMELEVRNQALQQSLAASKLQNLQSQLQPHFLHNTHNTIAALIRTNDQAGALKVLHELSGLLRESLAQGDLIKVPLRDELKMADHYLAIQMVRFPNRLNIDRDIEPGCDRALVPGMVLQPLIENAVRHGVLSDQTGDTLTLKVQRLDDQLRVQIANTTGPDSSDDPGFGIGLKNTRQRLHHLYGSQQSLELEYLSPQRIQATLCIPFEEMDEQTAYARGPSG